MMKKSLAILLIGSVTLLFYSFSIVKVNENYSDNETVWSILIQLGKEAPLDYVEKPDPLLVQLGYELVHVGKATPPTGGLSSVISPYFVCTDCHNQVKEDPDPAHPNPKDRLTFAKENELLFLQATTFWGMVNREKWYNDDYILKYGDLVKPASESLYESSQLCAQECSSGRKLKQWEWESINHYYYSIQLKMADLRLSTEEEEFINIALQFNEDKEQAIELMRSKYMLWSPAQFGEDPDNYAKGYEGLQGDSSNGELIYDLSCKTCHAYGGPSQLVLDDSKLTKKKFKKNIDKHNLFNLYKIVRHGTQAELGHQQYMPLYTLDRMSNQQLEDLRTFLLGE